MKTEKINKIIDKLSLVVFSIGLIIYFLIFKFFGDTYFLSGLIPNFKLIITDLQFLYLVCIPIIIILSFIFGLIKPKYKNKTDALIIGVADDLLFILFFILWNNIELNIFVILFPFILLLFIYGQHKFNKNDDEFNKFIIIFLTYLYAVLIAYIFTEFSNSFYRADYYWVLILITLFVGINLFWSIKYRDSLPIFSIIFGLIAISLKIMGTEKNTLNSYEVGFYEDILTYLKFLVIASFSIFFLFEISVSFKNKISRLLKKLK